MATKPTYYQVRETFLGTLDGVAVEFYKGEIIDADDPAYRKWPENFVPLVTRSYRPDVEAATAAPGEKRGA
jgi:hypothetical protein